MFENPNVSEALTIHALRNNYVCLFRFFSCVPTIRAPACLKRESYFVSTILVIAWFAVSIAGIIINKELLSGNPNALFQKITNFHHGTTSETQPVPDATVVSPLLISVITAVCTCVLGALHVLGLPFLAYFGLAPKYFLQEFKRLATIERTGYQMLYDIHSL